MSEGSTNNNTFSSVTDAKPFVPSTQRKTNLKTNATPFIPGYKTPNETDSTSMDYQLPQNTYLPANSGLTDTYGYDIDNEYDNDNSEMYYYSPDMNNQNENPINIPFIFPPPGKKMVKNIFIPADIQKYYEMETAAIIDQEPPSDPRYKQVPSRYQSLKELGSTSSDNTTGSFGYISSTYKVIDKKDGNPYIIRRFERVRTTNEQIEMVLKAWSIVSHPNIISLNDCYLYNGALLFIHDYHPNAQSIAKKYLSEKGAILPEDHLWCILVQILSALNIIHSKGLACRSVSVLHILETGRNRFRLSGCGINDVLDPKQNVQEEQIKDLMNLGSVILLLGCLNTNKPTLPLFGSMYSRELTTVIKQLLSHSVNCMQALSYCLPQVLRTLNSSFLSNDYLSNCLGTEINNSRYLRMLIKLGFINERPSFCNNTRWSETGDRYLLKLFRDYLFHQEDENGAPNLDIGHVFDTLAKLDIGFDEQIALHSRDGKTFLICSYADIKRCLDEVFIELREKSTYKALSLPSSASSAPLFYPSSTLSPISASVPSSSLSSSIAAASFVPASINTSSMSIPMSPSMMPAASLQKPISTPYTTSLLVSPQKPRVTHPSVPRNTIPQTSTGMNVPMATPMNSSMPNVLNRYSQDMPYKQNPVTSYSSRDPWGQY